MNLLTKQVLAAILGLGFMAVFTAFLLRLNVVTQSGSQDDAARGLLVFFLFLSLCATATCGALIRYWGHRK